MYKVLIKGLYNLIIISVVIVSCTKDEPLVLQETDHVLFVYMPWSSNLTSYFQQNIVDFETAIKRDVLKDNRIIVFLMHSPYEATLFELKFSEGDCIRETLKEYVNPDITIADWITALLSDVKYFAPAKRYSMIVSSHGMGWLPVSSPKARNFGQKDYWEYEGVPMTRYFGGLTSEYQIDITTFAEGISNAGLKMEYILFDDCYMSTIEVAYDLKDVTDYLIGSPTEVMAYGYPYAEILQYLIGNIDYHGICNGFYSFYSNYSMPCGTICVTKSSELDSLVSIMKEINQRFSFDPALLDSVQRMDGYNPVIFFDFGDYVEKLCFDDKLLSSFEAQLERTVGYRMNTRNYYSMNLGQVEISSFSGITISDPSVNPIAVLKDETAWYKITR